tara:strand:+ start:1022 stop:1474 length:453 start_codon:yes stop_codon:yes gene_type:complete
LKKILIFILLFNFFSALKSDDIKLSNEFTFLSKQKLFHHPPDPMFLDRQINLKLANTIPEDEIENIFIYLKTDKMNNYREFKLENHSGLSSFNFDFKFFKGNSIEYYFIVNTKNNTSYACPIDKSFNIKPVQRIFLNSVEYYKQKQRKNK